MIRTKSAVSLPKPKNNLGLNRFNPGRSSVVAVVRRSPSISGHLNENLKSTQFLSNRSSRNPSPYKPPSKHSSSDHLNLEVNDCSKIWDQRILPKADTFKACIPELFEIRRTLTDTSIDWNKRVLAMKKLRGCAFKFGEDHGFVRECTKFNEAFMLSIKDLRSKIHLEIFATLSYITSIIRDRFTHTLVYLVPETLQLFTSSSLPTVSAAYSGLKQIYTHAQSHSLLEIINHSIETSKSAPIRRKCILILLTVINTWEHARIEKSIELIDKMICHALVDADSEVRATSSDCFWTLFHIFPEYAHKIYDSAKQRSKTLLVQKCHSLEAVQIITGKAEKVPKQPSPKLNTELPKPMIAKNQDEPEHANTAPSPYISSSEENSESVMNTTNTALLGPPGYTPFSAKHPDPFFAEMNKITEMMSSVEIDSLLIDLKGADTSRTLSTLETLRNLIISKSKLSISNIVKLYLSLSDLLPQSTHIANETVKTLNLLVPAYNFHSEQWLEVLISRLIRLDPNDIPDILEFFITLQTNLDPSPLLLLCKNAMRTNFNDELTHANKYISYIISNIDHVDNHPILDSFLVQLITLCFNNQSAADSFHRDTILSINRINPSLLTRLDLPQSLKLELEDFIRQSNLKEFSVCISDGFVTKRRVRFNDAQHGSSNHDELDISLQNKDNIWDLLELTRNCPCDAHVLQMIFAATLSTDIDALKQIITYIVTSFPSIISTHLTKVILLIARVLQNDTNSLQFTLNLFSQMSYIKLTTFINEITVHLKAYHSLSLGFLRISSVLLSSLLIVENDAILEDFMSILIEIILRDDHTLYEASLKCLVHTYRLMEFQQFIKHMILLPNSQKIQIMNYIHQNIQSNVI